MKKRRDVVWTQAVDDLAIKLASEAGFYPEKVNGGVSKYLASLVLKAVGGDTRSPIEQHVGKIRAAESALKKKPSK